MDVIVTLSVPFSKSVNKNYSDKNHTYYGTVCDNKAVTLVKFVTIKHYYGEDRDKIPIKNQKHKWKDE